MNMSDNGFVEMEISLQRESNQDVINNVNSFPSAFSSKTVIKISNELR